MEIICVSNVRQLYLGNINYANDNDDWYADRGHVVYPEYFKFDTDPGGYNARVLLNSYLASGVNFCPIQTGSTGPGFRFFHPEPYIYGRYANWSAGTPAVIATGNWLVVTGYISFAGFDHDSSHPVVYVSGEPRFPNRLSEGEPNSALISHQRRDNTHDFMHGGGGFWADILNLSYSSPLGYADGSAVLHRASEIRLRTTGGPAAGTKY